MKNQRKHLFKNQFGFSMVEVLVAGAITTVIGMGVVSTTVNSMKAAKNVDQKSELNDTSSMISLAMGDNRSCGAFLHNSLATHNITGANFGTRVINQIQMCNPADASACSTILALNQTLGSGVQATGLRLVEAATPTSLGTVSLTAPAWGATAGTINYEKYQAQIEIDFTKVNAASSVGAAQFRTITKGIIILVNPSNDRVELCYGMDSPEAACRDHLGGTFDPNKNPSCRIENVSISNNLWITDISNYADYSTMVGEPSSGVNGPNAANMALYGQNPGISFNPPLTGSAPGPYSSVGPADSGSAITYFDISANRFKVMARPSGGILELNSPNGDIEMYTNSTLVVRIPEIGGVQVHRNIEMQGGAIVTTSDRRLKSDIKPLENSLEKIISLDGKSYHYKADKSRKMEAGFIAQEVRKVIPEAVVQRSDGYFGVSYTVFIAYLSEAIKELKELFDSKSAEQDAKIALLQEQVQQLVQRVESCEQKSK